jgi:hypothetical protein
MILTKAEYKNIDFTSNLMKTGIDNKGNKNT